MELPLLPADAPGRRPRSRPTSRTSTGRSKRTPRAIVTDGRPLLALDIASTTGWAVVSTLDWRLVTWGAWQIRQDGASLLPALVRLERRVQDLIDFHRPALVGIERPFLRGGDPTVITGSMVRVVRDLCSLEGIPVRLVSPPEWRSRILGDGGARKPAAVVHACRLSGDDQVGHDAAEAICVADYFARMLRST